MVSLGESPRCVSHVQCQFVNFLYFPKDTTTILVCFGGVRARNGPRILPLPINAVLWSLRPILFVPHPPPHMRKRARIETSHVSPRALAAYSPTTSKPNLVHHGGWHDDEKWNLIPCQSSPGLLWSFVFCSFSRWMCQGTFHPATQVWRRCKWLKRSKDSKSYVNM